eukprot:6213348-Pleurochrysis_carterae.AAC.4
MVGERAQHGGWARLGAPTRRLKEKGAHWARAATAAGFQDLGKRSASAPQVCMRRESETTNRACESQLQMKGARDDSL